MTDIAFSAGGTKPLVTINDGADTLALGSPVGALPTPTLDGDTATYPDVLPGVDLQLRADVDGFSQTLVVKNAKAAANPKLDRLAFSTTGRGMSLASDKAGNLRILGDTGRVRFTGSTPVMWNAAHAQRGNGIAGQGNAKRSKMPVEIGNRQIAILPDQQMLSSTATYPVYIDPGFTVNRSRFAVVNSGLPDTAFWNPADDAFVGSWDSGASKFRSFFSMDLTGTGLAGKRVWSAQLNLQEKYASTCEPSEFQVWTADIPTPDTTWNNQPAWYSQQGTSTASLGYSPQGMGGTSTCPAGPVDIDVTPALQSAADSGWNGLAFGLRASDETNPKSWKRFDNNPTLTVTYAGDGTSNPDPSANEAAEQELWRKQGILTEFRTWINSLPDLGTSGYIESVNTAANLSTTLLWFGPADATQAAILAEAQRLGIVATVQQRQYSRQAIDTAIAQVADRTGEGAFTHFLVDSGSIDSDFNGIVITGRHGDRAADGSETELRFDTAAAHAAEDQRIATGASQELGIAVKISDNDRPVATATSRGSDTPAFNAGGFMVGLPGGGLCSSGFAIKIGSRTYTTTARHCSEGNYYPYAGTTLTSYGYSVKTSTDGAARTLFGTGSALMFYGPYNSTLRAKVVGYGDVGMGDYVCTSGGNSGTHCGGKLNQTVTNMSAMWNDGFGKVSTIAARRLDGGIALITGDSGGPVYQNVPGASTVRAVGMIQAVTGILPAASCGSIRVKGTCGNTVLFTSMRTIVRGISGASLVTG